MIMRARSWFALLPFGILACTQATSVSAPEEAEGSLSLALIGGDAHGHSYRLRNAEFEIYGCADYSYTSSGQQAGTGGNSGQGGGPVCTSIIVSSEDDPDAALITRRLIPGYYNVTLLGGWNLEEQTPAGWTAVGQAILLSPTSQSAYVWDRGQSQVYFSFGVGGDLIDFRHGDLGIGIEVEQPGDRDCYYGGSAGGAGGSYAAGSYASGGYGGGVSCGTGGAAGVPVPIAGTGAEAAGSGGVGGSESASGAGGL
jgi:hypothetical protein